MDNTTTQTTPDGASSGVSDLSTDAFADFCEQRLRIQLSDKGLTPFKLFDFQERLSKFYEDNQKVILKKFQGCGFTLTSVAWMLWKAMHQSDVHACIVGAWSSGPSQSEYLVLDLLEKMVDPPTFTRESGRIRFSNGSSISFSKIEDLSSQFANHFFFDEFDHCTHIVESGRATFNLILSQLPEQGKCIVLSDVPSRENSFFKDLWSEGYKPNGRMKTFECSFREHPDYHDLVKLKEIREGMSSDEFRRLVLGKFVGDPSTATSIPPDLANRLNGFMKDIHDPLIFTRKSSAFRNEPEIRDLFTQLLSTGSALFSTDPGEPKLVYWGLETDTEMPILQREPVKTVEPIVLKDSDDLLRLSGLKPEPLTEASVTDDLVADPWEMDGDDVVVSRRDEYGDGRTLALAGVNLAGTVTEEEVPDYRYEILKEVRNLFSGSMTLAFNKKFLMVNGLSTRIRSAPIGMAFQGLSEFYGEKKAVQMVAKMIRKKLEKLFPTKLLNS
jgi:hypothetical protein